MNRLRILFVFLLLIICVSLTKYQKDCFSAMKDVDEKTIWLLWFQGWDNVPWLVERVKESWMHFNPDWNIELVTEANLGNYIEDTSFMNKNISYAAKSDIIRLELLYRHGGVWADATMLCMRPLSTWVYDVLQPCGFWMYRGTNHGSSNAPASWFMMSRRESPIIKAWTEGMRNYWIGREEPHEYFWMDSIFVDKLQNDHEFAEEWSNVPYLHYEDMGQAHILGQRVMENDKNLQDSLISAMPFAVKLSFHGFNPDVPSNGRFAIEYALSTPISFDFPDHSIVYKTK